MAKRGSTAWMAQTWGPPGPHGLETWQLTPEVWVTTKRAARPAFERLAAICATHGYRIRPGVTGAYNYRRIRGGRGWSNHAWGLALDVNWDKNPMTSQLTTDMPAAMVADIKAIKTKAGLPVFRWGGDYKGRKDAMHFEIMVTPQELALGLADQVLTEQQEKENDVLNYGDKGPAVAKLQMTINGILSRTERLHPAHEDVPQIKVDGVWGNETTRGLTHAHARAQQICQRDWGPHWSPAQVDMMDIALLSEAVSRLGDQLKTA